MSATEQAGTLAGWSVPITPLLVVSTAIATRDFQDVHHDKARAQELGSKDIFVNILTTQGLVQRYVTDRLGHDIEVLSIAVRLGAPAYPGDTLEFSGGLEGEDEGVETWKIIGEVSLGSHVTATVRVRR